MYQQQRDYDLVSLKQIGQWQLYAYWNAFVVFMVPAWGMGGASVKNGEGLDIDLFAWLLCAYSIMVTTHHMQVFIFT